MYLYLSDFALSKFEMRSDDIISPRKYIPFSINFPLLKKSPNPRPNYPIARYKARISCHVHLFLCVPLTVFLIHFIHLF